MKFRTLIRVVGVEGEYLVVVLPGWDYKVNIKFPLDIFPKEILDNAKTIPDYRFYGKVNLDADTIEELELTDIEIPSKGTLQICVEKFIDRFKGCEEWEEFKKGEEKFALFCHSQLSGGIAMKIRNELGLWKEKSEIRDWFNKYYGCNHADDVSHIILIHIHRYISKNIKN